MTQPTIQNDNRMDRMIGTKKNNVKKKNLKRLPKLSYVRVIDS